MVSTRAHKTEFPPPDLSPSKSQSLTTTRTPGRPSTKSSKWTHTPDPPTLIWLLISLPLVIWDAIYVLLRPHTMPGGSLSWPIYTPYVLYGQIDYIYGEKAWKEHNGFTAAQTALNVFETAGYLGYLWVVWKYGRGETRTLGGGWGGVACLTGFALSVMTVSKTVLYLLNEVFSGFSNIGHNDPFTLIFMWILPNGAWIVVPTYMGYIFAVEILRGLSIASGDSSSKPARAIAYSKEE